MHACMYVRYVRVYVMYVWMYVCVCVYLAAAAVGTHFRHNFRTVSALALAFYCGYAHPLCGPMKSLSSSRIVLCEFCSIHKNIHIHITIHVHVHIHVHIHIHIRIHIHVNVRVHLHTYIYICICIYENIHIYTYIILKSQLSPKSGQDFRNGRLRMSTCLILHGSQHVPPNHPSTRGGHTHRLSEGCCSATS
jgi:hypothetical protein